MVNHRWQLKLRSLAYTAAVAGRTGLRDENDQPDDEALELITVANLETAEWVQSFRD